MVRALRSAGSVGAAGWVGGLLLLTACHHAAVGHDTASSAPTPSLRPIVIQHPLTRWQRDAFAEMAPTVRMSVPTGGDAETRVYLRLPPGASITIRSPATPSLVFPPGTESDRVSYVMGEGGRARAVADVRGTRWDERGVEYFHVYLPRDDREDAELVGVEWRRDDAEEERAATAWLVAWGRDHRSPETGRTMDADDADRFRSLNHCQSCHVADKAEASSMDDDMPPWPTDARGLYTPSAVFASHAVLSTSSSFDDRNATDPFMSFRCAKGAPRLHGDDGHHWFSCRDGAPVGERDLSAALKMNDAYAIRTCRARRYLFTHMDATARAVFEPSLRVCPPT